MSGGRSRSFSRDVGDTYLLINSIVYVWLTNRRQKNVAQVSKMLIICLAVASFVSFLRSDKDSTTFRALLRRGNGEFTKPQR